MISPVEVTIDGNEAVATIAYRINEVCAIYPITPSSTMAELADQWASEGRPNLWGHIPTVIEMQSEGGAAGAVHGALQTGALTTTFTASQGLLLMIPNLYKIAGELTPMVIHVAARAIAAQGLSIFGDHSDVAAVRPTGLAQLASGSVQEAHDMALIAQAASLKSRIPFLHFFDGFRTSHEINKICLIPDDTIRALIDPEAIRLHRARGLTPEAPVIRGTAQNPDVYFQARETVNPFYQKLPGILESQMDAFSKLTGRHYGLFDYKGHPEAERIIVIMGSASATVAETVKSLVRDGERVGVIIVRLCLPFSGDHFLRALPPTCRSLAVMDRLKSPGATGEPLYADVVTTCSEAIGSGRLSIDAWPRVIGGRYGLSSKEFTPAMVKAIFDEMAKESPKNHFTIGIDDDVSGSSLVYDASFQIEPEDVVRAIFMGLGSDGTVGANKNSIKIIGESTPLHAQGYFVYDSKKSGSKTFSHVRFGPRPIHAPYLIEAASFIGCHQFGFVEQLDILEKAALGATLLLDSPFSSDEVWDHLPRSFQKTLIDKKIAFYVIDAGKVAEASGMGRHTNTIMQTCFFAISGVLPADEAIEKIKSSIRKTYGKKGEAVVLKNFEAVDRTLASLQRVTVPRAVSSNHERPPLVSDHAPEFVKAVTQAMMAGNGDRLPVSSLPVDGTYPTGTTQWEKRNISDTIPVWDPESCIQCGHCGFVCPHAVIRSKFYSSHDLNGAPESFKSADINARGFPDIRFTLQVYAEDCTGCRLCVEVCPVQNLDDPKLRAINMAEKAPILESERNNIQFFEGLAINDRSAVDFASVRGVQFLQPLFEFSGACAGCGETPYLKVLSQLFGDRLVVANATGCSSIYGGNLPTTPWTKNQEGRGPAWSNSLFEDNAEFGLGFRLSADLHLRMAIEGLKGMEGVIDQTWIDAILGASQFTESEIRKQRQRVNALRKLLAQIDSEPARELLSVVDHLVRRSVWIIGGDGWAYDIGSSGLDHVLASGRNVNVLVLDTEVYSNTGGQMSKATPLGAVAKFAAGGKPLAKKDLALQAIAYGNVYVARIAMGANPQQTLLALREAEAYPGPSLILAYSHCIAHGINMEEGLKQQALATSSGHWPLVRYNPALRDTGSNPFVLDSPRPRIPLRTYQENELRFRTLAQAHPEEFEHLMGLAQRVVDQKWAIYEEMATGSGDRFHPDAGMRDVIQQRTGI